jgi:Domain of unknown function (DUF1707)
MQPSSQHDSARAEPARAEPARAEPARAEPARAEPARAEPARAESAPRLSPAIRVSDQDRDHVAQILQAAFAEGRLDDDEFDERMRAALTARTSADLEALSADLPAMAARPGSAVAAAGRKPGRFAIAYKNSIRRGGRWRVPEHFTSVVYKGSGWLDLRAAELTAPEVTVLAVAYKSRIDVLVPPGVRVELDGFGVSKSWSEQEELESRTPRDAPVVHVRGVAYKGSIEVSTRPPGPDEPGRLR